MSALHKWEHPSPLHPRLLRPPITPMVLLLCLWLLLQLKVSHWLVHPCDHIIKERDDWRFSEMRHHLAHRILKGKTGGCTFCLQNIFLLPSYTSNDPQLRGHFNSINVALKYVLYVIRKVLRDHVTAADLSIPCIRKWFWNSNQKLLQGSISMFFFLCVGNKWPFFNITHHQNICVFTLLNVS